MARPKKKVYTTKEKLLMLKEAGLTVDKTVNSNESITNNESDTFIDSLSDRIQKVLNIIQSKPLKSVDMLALIMYDIENNKVRTLLAKYLIENGCVRIQKSVYLLRSSRKLFQEIEQTIKEIQELYENEDSILLVPIPINTPESMKIIGKDIQIDTLVNKPNTLFF